MKKILYTLFMISFLLLNKLQAENEAESNGCYIKNMAGKQPGYICDLKDFFQNMQKYGDVNPHNVLIFQGVSGVGKSAGAEAFSHEITLNTFKYSASDLIKSEPGKSAAEIRTLYENAAEIANENQIVVIFIDEVDALSRPDRNEMTDEHKSALLELCYQLDKNSDQPYILTIMTTKIATQLDESLRSRGQIITWQLPDSEKRGKIIEYYVEQSGLEKLDKKNIDDFAYESSNFSCGNIKLAIKQAAQQTKLHNISDPKLVVETIKQTINQVRKEYDIKEEYSWYSPKGFIEKHPEVKELPKKVIVSTLAITIGVFSTDIAEKIVKSKVLQKITQKTADKIVKPLDRIIRGTISKRGEIKHPTKLRPH